MGLRRHFDHSSPLGPLWVLFGVWGAGWGVVGLWATVMGVMGLGWVFV